MDYLSLIRLNVTSSYSAANNPSTPSHGTDDLALRQIMGGIAPALEMVNSPVRCHNITRR
jgi:hypothetical protein